MIRHLSTTTVPLTRELAEEFATMPTWRGERPLRPARLAFLRCRLADGKFHPPRWARTRLADRLYRVNGQHSSYMLANLDGEFPFNLPVIIDDYLCDSEQDLCELFAQFDVPQSVRTQADLANAHACVHPDLEGIAPSRVDNATAGIALAMQNGQSRKLDREERARLVHMHPDFVRWAAPYLRDRKLQRPGVAAAMFITYRYHPEVADEFWGFVKDTNHADPKHPTKVLGRFLADSLYRRADPETGRAWTSHAYYVKCLHAWNA